MKITDKYIFFWKENPFCNFTKCNIKFDFPDSVHGEEIYFSSSEQMFMWFKAKFFGDDVIAKKILNTDSPEEARRLGRLVHNYDDKKWNTVRYEYMKKAISYKFTQNKDLRENLCSPKYNGKHFVEAAYYDRIWGIGYDEYNAVRTPESSWGQNLLGKILDEVRDWCIKNKEVLK